MPPCRPTRPAACCRLSPPSFAVLYFCTDRHACPDAAYARTIVGLSSGKTFHPGDPFQFDYPHSWSFDETPYSFGAYFSGSPQGGALHPTWRKQLNTTSDAVWCDNKTVVCRDGVMDCPDGAEIAAGSLWANCNVSKLEKGQQLWDMNERDFAIEKLQFAAKSQAAERARGDTARPFFLGVGFHRPHLPWVAPLEFYALYPPADTMPGPVHPDVPVGMPPVAWHSGGSNSIAKPLAATTTKEARRGLYATMSYVDSLVGAVLDELTRLGLADNTVVSLIGDHGQHVGEQNFWVKMTNFVSIRRVQRSGHRWCCNPLCLLAFSGNCRR